MPDTIQIAIEAIDRASSVIGGVGTSLDKMSKQSETASRSIDAVGMASESINSKLAKLGASTDSVTRAQNQLKVAEIELVEASRRLSQAQENLANNTDPSKLDALNKELAKAQVELDGAGKKVQDLSIKIASSSSVVETAEKKFTLFGLSAQQIGDKMSKAGKAMTIGITLPIAGLAVAATKAASDLNETSNKIDTLFGKSSEAIKKFANTASTALGQSKKQALDAAADFAVFGKAAGLAGNDLVDFSKKNVQLAADMASFFNTSPEEAITAIGAAFRGESEPIRRYGVLINEASLKDEALRMGLIKTTTEALQPQQRVLAAQALILQQTGAAQGDFARTSEGLANQSRILNAQFQDTIATLGQSLLPIAIKMAGTANDLLKAFNDLDQPQKDLIVGFGLLAAGIGPVLTVGGKLITVFSALQSVSVDVAGGMLSAGKTIGETAGYLKEVGVSAESLKFAFQNLKAAGVILGAELGVIVLGLIAIVKYLGEVDAASKATSEELIAMSRSGDVFKQAGASTEILVHGQDRLKAALDATHEQIRLGARDYADYKASIEATAQAAGYQIDAQGNLIQVFSGSGGEQRRLIEANYLLTDATYRQAEAQNFVSAATLNSAQNMGILGAEINRAKSQVQESAAANRDQVEGLRALAEATAAAGPAQAEYQKWLEQEAAAQNAAIQAEAAHRGSIAESIASNDKLAQSLKNATEAQAVQTLAQGQLDVLKAAYESGKISVEDFQKATDQVLLTYNLATPKSIAMAEAQDKINKAFLEGKIPVDKYIESTGKIPKIAADGKVTLKELTDLGIRPTTVAVREQENGVIDLAQAWNRVPENVKTIYTIETHGEVPAGEKPSAPSGPTPRGYQYGGSYIVPANPRGGAGDYFPILAAPGERVTVQTKAQQTAAPAPAPSGDTFNYVTNVYNPLAAAMLADKQRRDRLARSNARMGVT